jgi:NTE family protein
LFTNIDFEIGLEAEFYNLNQAVGNTLALKDNNFLFKPFLKFSYNTLNRPYFPTKGQSLHIKGVASDRSWGSIANFIQVSGRWRSTFRLFNNINLTNTLFAGYSSTNNLPLHYNYYLGGLAQNPVFTLRQQPFLGYESQQLRTSNVILWQQSLQYQLTNNIYLSGNFDIAHLADNWTFNLTKERLEYGFGISVGATTILGPIELSLSTPNLTDSYALKIDVGYNF